MGHVTRNRQDGVDTNTVAAAKGRLLYDAQAILTDV
jgi:hypothetical protein